MLAVKGIFDGQKVHLLEKVTETKKFKVVVTFIEEVADGEDISVIREYAADEPAFSFWQDSGENLYQDYLKKK